MIMVKQYIEKHSLTQTEAANIMGVDQPRINKLLQGNIELFTIDKLVQMLEHAGIHLILKKAA